MSQRTKYAHFVQFHISKQAREKYAFNEHLFSSSGNVVFASFHAARLFAEKMNARRDLTSHPERAVQASQINALGLIDELLHKVVALYRQQVNPQVFQSALDYLTADFGARKVDIVLLKFVEEFPPLEVYKGKMTPENYLKGSTGSTSNRLIALEEMLMLWLANMNPAFQPFLELFDDTTLREKTIYQSVMASLAVFLKKEPGFGPGKLDLLTLLRQPALANPHSLEAQLRFISEMWGSFLGDFLLRLLSSLDFIKEELKPVFFGPAPTEVAEFADVEFEPEQFSADLHWMPRLVLIAKSALVWMEQLSKKYSRSITRLNEIPDAELNQLAAWGFTGLWLIGVWQRSEASRRIKQMCGNPEAESSAYSLFDYEIADEVGGYDALQNLKARCQQRGIRLACDMVPNHTGIDSKWTREHPDWFISLPYSPFPGYSFNGPNLSGDQRYGVFIEDKYYDRSDAAVAFKREDYWSGDVRYIYHGNDGTNMPWNDTAQLNYLMPEVREAVIQKILHVARMFPVIRFDAAMTLAKRHFQRLWFPEPGSGGDIPSRAEHGLTKKEFNARIPVEFWREVVDRVAQEVPDTLLLAEAFWLMEGYFVRTLGMHRVYNSAFMNMLKNEENEKYRQTVINTIQFNPEILKRYVNFLNNPDEDTAIVQFGDGDKYFGACLMLVTMPGLPMFGHGQIEGFHEKYGMEYRRAYWDEQVNDGLVQRHEWEIFPLLKKRYLFAEVENFLFYDFVTPQGHVNHNIFVFSNRFGDERALVVYNNKFADTAGWVRTSVPFRQKTNEHDDPVLLHKQISEGLALPADETAFCVFKDVVSGLEYIRSCKDISERGFYFELNAYDRHVYIDFQVILDDGFHHYAQIHHYLAGRGVRSVREEVQELSLRHLLEPLDGMLNRQFFELFYAEAVNKNKSRRNKKFRDEIENKFTAFVVEIRKHVSGTGHEKRLVAAFLKEIGALCQLSDLETLFPLPNSRKYRSALKRLQKTLAGKKETWAVLFSWVLLRKTGYAVRGGNVENGSRRLFDDWLFRKRVQNLVAPFVGETEAEKWVSLVALLIGQQNWFDFSGTKKGRAFHLLQARLMSQDVRSFLQVNWYDDILWFNKERFEELCSWLFLIAVIDTVVANEKKKGTIPTLIADEFSVIEKWLQAEKKSEFQVEKLLELLSPAKKVSSRQHVKKPAKKTTGWVKK